MDSHHGLCVYFPALVPSIKGAMAPWSKGMAVGIEHVIAVRRALYENARPAASERRMYLDRCCSVNYENHASCLSSNLADR